MKKYLDIVFFASYNNPLGTYFRWHNWAIALTKLGHKVRVITYDKSPSFEETKKEIDGIDYLIYPSVKGQGLFSHESHPWLILKALFKEFPKADVYHLFQPFPLSTYPAYFHRDKTKLLVYDWDDLWYGGILELDRPRKLFPDRFALHFINKTERKMPAKSDLVTVCGDYLKEKALGLGAKKVEIVYNGFWNDVVKIPRAQAREEFGLQKDAYYFGFMGRTIGEIEWCFDALLCSSENYRLALCGMSNEWESICPLHLRSRIDHLGFLKPSDAKKFGMAIDCGLLPLKDIPFNQSRFPIKFAEYLTLGAFVITSAIGEIAKLAPKYGGTKLAGKTREEWKQALKEHVSDIENGRLSDTVNEGLILQDLEWSNIGQRLERMYLENIKA